VKRGTFAFKQSISNYEKKRTVFWTLEYISALDLDYSYTIATYHTSAISRFRTTKWNVKTNIYAYHKKIRKPKTSFL